MKGIMGLVQLALMALEMDLESMDGKIELLEQNLHIWVVPYI